MSDKKETYNGWSNYATWRVNLEIVDGYHWSSDEVTFKDIGSLKEYIKDFVESCIENECVENTSLTYSYAIAFISDVNYHEIAEYVIENYPSLITGKDTQDGEALTD